MDGVVFFCGIAASELENYLGATRVTGEKFGDVPDIAV
jgi:hypothetical protein